MVGLPLTSLTITHITPEQICAVESPVAADSASSRIYNLPRLLSSALSGSSKEALMHTVYTALVSQLQNRLNTDVVLSDIPHLSISCPSQVAQNKSAWRAQTCSTRT